jgi:phosphohistidine phosphatase
MDIYFLRHASAGETLPNPKKDEKRPLDKTGVEQTAQIGQVLASMGVAVDTIVSSPLTRASQTASLVAKELGHTSKIQLDDALRPDASYAQFQEMVRRYHKRQCIIVTGHNPTLSEFLSRFISDGAVKYAVELRKGAVARVEVKPSKRTLHWCLTPKTVRAAYETAASSSRPKTSRK